MTGTASVGTFSVGTAEDSAITAALSGVSASASIGDFSVSARAGTVAVDESDFIVIDPGWTDMEIDLTVDVTLT